MLDFVPAVGPGLQFPGTPAQPMPIGDLVSACISYEMCPYGNCNASVRRGLAAFIGCYEGPAGENDGQPPDELVTPCLNSSGLPVSSIMACAGSNHSSRQAVRWCHNRAEVALSHKLGLPYITLDGIYSSGNNAYSMLPEVCDIARGRLATVPKECNLEPLQFNLQMYCSEIGVGNYTYFDFMRSRARIEAAFSLAAQTLISYDTFPEHFADAGFGSASRVRGAFLTSITVTADLSQGTQQGPTNFAVGFDVLHAYHDVLAKRLPSSAFEHFLFYNIEQLVPNFKHIGNCWTSMSVASNQTRDTHKLLV